MKMLELFSGSKVMSNTFKACGWDVFTIDIEQKYKPSLRTDISTLKSDMIIKKFGRPDVIWSSPPCECFSIASVGDNWPDRIPTTRTIDNIKVHLNALKIIFELSPTYWFVENPRGLLRKMSWMQGLRCYTVTYCQYGDNRMKPTDIWTNHPSPLFKPMCHRGDKCHEAAPRGSGKGSEGKASYYERSIIPEDLCKHIVKICEPNYRPIGGLQKKLIEA